ncbi:MAG: CDP-alcohol phosphatidyltransferase family protein [Steroidobacteraceae bacterium]
MSSHPMLDTTIQRFIARPLDSAGHALARTHISANAITLLGAVLAIPLIVALATRSYVMALVLLALNRLLDGLDGAVARATHRSPLGGYLDIVGDYVFYAGVPLGFALAAPTDNALPAATLLASFLLTCSSFLAYAALAAQQGLKIEPERSKSFFYSRGLMEGTETIAFFIAMMLWPARFPSLASVFAVLCVLTALQRSAIAVWRFGRRAP